MSEIVHEEGKIPFDIDVAMEAVAEAVESYPPAALFQLADEGYGSPFEQLVACMISIRTLDETTLVVGRRFFTRARTPQAVNQLSAVEIDALIAESNFHEAKARQLKTIAGRIVADFGGVMPCDEAVILSFPGIGPKCANLILGIGCGQARISVDVHVFRVTNRWGYVHATSPEQTLRVLEEELPHRYWLDINRLLVPFGKHICTGRLPHCSTCPVLPMCRQVGVTRHR
ncbi:MAG TPA: endonuclease III [Thermomicrobiaceae bacterium]|nr:endonuclease III [Thermomicrobiaceae bacterium]